MLYDAFRAFQSMSLPFGRILLHKNETLPMRCCGVPEPSRNYQTMTLAAESCY